MPIKSPPSLVPLTSITGEQFEQYQQFNRILDEKGRYLPWDEFQYRVSGGLNPVLAWSFTRRARDASLQFIPWSDERGQRAGFNKTGHQFMLCERVDKFATAQALREQQERLQGIGAALSQLQLDEAITSSQLEGANTTTLVARNMLASGRRARTESEQMIVGNARLMAEISEHLDEPLTVGLIRHLHAVGMGGIDDGKYTPGQFRDTNDIVIADYDGNIVHQPPKAESILERLQLICNWINETGNEYVHPFIRACILHFMIAHEHPFRDGNGRTCRALFYWFMLKNGYDVFRYVSISSLLYGAPSKYAHSYQYTETDSMDLTYFIEYQCSIVHRALDKFYTHIDMIIRRRIVVDRLLFESGVLRRLSQRQVTLVNIMMGEPEKGFTVAEVSEKLGISDNTARKDLRALVQEDIALEIPANDQQTVYQTVGRLRI